MNTEEDIFIGDVEVEPFVNDQHSGIIIYWDCPGTGFGEYTIYKEDNSLNVWTGDSEYMDNNNNKSFLKKLMSAWIDQIDINH